MKINLDYGYMKKIKYITLGFIIIYVCYELIHNLPQVISTVINFISTFLKIISPFIWGCILAYLLLPIVKWFENILSYIRIKKRNEGKLTKKGLKVRRMISLLLTFVLLIGILILTAYGLYVMVGGTVRDFSFNDAWINLKANMLQYLSLFDNLEEYLSVFGISKNYVQLINDYSNEVVLAIQSFVNNIMSSATDIGKGVIDFIFGFIFAANLIIHREYFGNIVENFLRLIFKEKNREAIQDTFSEINHVFMSFFRGQVIDLTLLGLVTSFALMIAGFEFSLMVGMFAGYTNLVPYLGSYLGALPIIFVSIANGGLGKGIFGYLFILVVQQIYITFVTPKIQGTSIGIHPMFILLSLTVFGSIFGLVGMILAIPLAGIIRIFVLKWTRYMQKKKDIKLIKIND